MDSPEHADRWSRCGAGSWFQSRLALRAGPQVEAGPPRPVGTLTQRLLGCDDEAARVREETVLSRHAATLPAAAGGAPFPRVSERRIPLRSAEGVVRVARLDAVEVEVPAGRFVCSCIELERRLTARDAAAAPGGAAWRLLTLLRRLDPAEELSWGGKVWVGDELPVAFRAEWTLRPAAGEGPLSLVSELVALRLARSA